ncbi:heparin lyase I family protein [Chryseobacterium sp. ISL-6]|uniref:heparin lyase I family protein n=1 Tax=Chryseobacterium sp. ISL-6 TaxID=2819143 RepID=UPI001BEC5360|nr:heparin lyase I family protein [Chryseobacterium sp. ISL-6]MBT2623679.1 heparin lyase I family protein [Chryseobacterium sp. ISL-6]
MSIADDKIKRIDIEDEADVNYRETTTWYDGSPMTDAKKDGFVYIKKDNIFYRRTFDSLETKNLIKGTLQSVKDLTPTEVLLLKMGVYESVQLQGYLAKGDLPKPVEFKIADPLTNIEGFEIVDVHDIKLVSEFTIEKQSTLPLVDTSWRVVYDVTCPERGTTDIDTSTIEYRDYINIKGVLNIHDLQQPVTVRVNSDRPSFGQRPLKSIKFNFRVVGWREFYKIDEAYLHLSEPPLAILSNLERDLIRVVKVGRLRYQLQVRQDYQNSVVIPKTKYERKSVGSIINYLKDEVNSIVTPNIIKNSYNYDEWMENVSWNNIFDKPEGKTVFPLKNDAKLNLAFQEIPLTTPHITRTGVYRETNYSTRTTFGWGTATTGMRDGITAEVILNSTRQFLRFKLRPNQVDVPQRSELSTVQPATPITGVENVRWFSGLLRLPENLKVAKGNTFIIIQFLPQDTPVGREPCVALYVKEGRLVLENRNNPRGTTGDLSGDGGINVRPTIRSRSWDLGAANLGSWDSIIIKASFSWTNSGTLQLWRNGELLVDYVGPNTWYDPNKNTPFIKFGIYNSLWASAAGENLDSSYDIQVDWCDPMLGGYQATYLSMTPYNITDYRGLRINVDGDVVNSKLFEQNSVRIATYPAIPTIQTSDVSTILSTGNYGISSTSTNTPVAGSGNLAVFRTSNGTILHIYAPNTGAQIYFNVRNAGVWTGWKGLIPSNATPSIKGLVNQSAGITDVSEVNSTAISLADLTPISTDDILPVSTDDASDPGTTQILANALKVAVNQIIPFINEQKAKTNSIIPFANDFKAKYNVASPLVNAVKAKLNTSFANDRTSGQQAP